jgi:hypothetical protein
VKTLPLVLVLGACIPPQDGTDPSDDPVARDIKHYNSVASELSVNLEEFRGEEADEPRIVGNRIFWLQFPQFNPDLYSWTPGQDSATRYTFGIGGNAYNYSPSDQLVVTASPEGGTVLYSAYAVSAADQLIDSLSLDAPQDEQRWWAYAADGSDVYLALTGDETEILKWTPGGESETLFTLEELGIDVGILWDIFAYRGRLLVIESGRLWLIDPHAKTAAFMQNETEVRSLSIDKNGVVYPGEGGPRYLAFAGGDPINIGEMIEASGYELNETFSNAHHYASHPILHNEHMYYIAQSGLFRISLESGEVEPVLLEPRNPELRTVFRAPHITDDGLLIMQTLVSENGAVGADGPIVMMQLE